MTKRSSGKVKPVPPKRTKPNKQNIFMSLTLVPLVIGGLLILAWALDIFLWENPQSQIFVGILFILLSFAASNALQKNLYAAAGWALLAVADLMLLVWVNLQLQIFAFLIGGIGLVLLLYEFIQRWQRENKQTAK